MEVVKELIANKPHQDDCTYVKNLCLWCDNEAKIL